MQYGTAPVLQFTKGSAQYSAVGTLDSIAIDTNIPLSKKIYWTVAYDENSAAEPWADSVSYAQDFKYFRFRIADNKKFEPRAARFRLRFQDDWGEQHMTYFTAYQGIPGGTPETREVTFEELRGLIADAEGEITLDQDIAVSGVVVSDRTSPNMGELTMPKAATRPDQGINDRTAYMQKRRRLAGHQTADHRRVAEQPGALQQTQALVQGSHADQAEQPRTLYAERRDAGPHRHQRVRHGRRTARKAAIHRPADRRRHLHLCDAQALPDGYTHGPLRPGVHQLHEQLQHHLSQHRSRQPR